MLMIYPNSFFPTPENLIRKMIYKLKETRNIKYILEPSAGKGDIIDFYQKWYRTHNSIWKSDQDINDYIVFDAIEKDENLSSLLRGKKNNVVHDDFLTFTANRYYDLIILNPPFDNGADHLLKAIKIQERIGGEIVCLLNAETLKNPIYRNRKHLITLLEDYNADIEYIENAFSYAERKTDVETALIYINVPMKDNKTIFEKEFKRDNPNIDINDINQVTEKKTKLEQLIFECDLIKKSSENLFKEKLKVDGLLKSMNIKSELTIADNSYKPESLTINEFIDKINLDYWEKFISETDFKKRLPSDLRTNFSYNIFQSTLPYRERRATILILLPCYVFQSTLPYRERL